MAPQPRFHIITILLADNASTQTDFNLNPGTRITHASATIGAGGPPIRVAITLLQPRSPATIFTLLAGGWIRGMGVAPATSHDVVWDGDITIGTDMALRFQARNDTGATHAFSAFFAVEE